MSTSVSDGIRLITSSYSPLSSSATNMGNGKLKGEALSKFIKRSVEMI